MPGTIKPADFSDRVTDVNRYRWTLDKIEHVVAAMKGRPALVETDSRTGHTVYGEIVGHASTGSSNPGARLQIRDADGRVTNYYLPSVGVIVDLGEEGRGAKWDALDRRRKAERAACDEARRLLGEEHGLDPMEFGAKISAEVYSDGFGAWTVTYRSEGMRSYERLACYRVNVRDLIPA